MERVSENMHVVANEPSLALYRLQEHVRKALPFMVEKRGEFAQLHEQLQGRTYDTDYAVRYTWHIVGEYKPFLSRSSVSDCCLSWGGALPPQ